MPLLIFISAVVIVISFPRTLYLLRWKVFSGKAVWLLGLVTVRRLFSFLFFLFFNIYLKLFVYHRV